MPLAETVPSALAPAMAAAAEPISLVSSPDEVLMELVREYLKVHAERTKFDKVTERIEAKWEARHPMPEALRVRPGDADLNLPCSVSEEGEWATRIRWTSRICRSPSGGKPWCSTRLKGCNTRMAEKASILCAVARGTSTR